MFNAVSLSGGAFFGSNYETTKIQLNPDGLQMLSSGPFTKEKLKTFHNYAHKLGHPERRKTKQAVRLTLVNQSNCLILVRSQATPEFSVSFWLEPNI